MLKFRFPDKPTEAMPDFFSYINEKDWTAQWKYDGWRAEIYFDNPMSIRLLSRMNKDLVQTVKNDLPKSIFEDIRNLNLPDNTVLDAEFVGRRGKHNTMFYIFDCLALDNQWLTNKPFIERWDICKNLNVSGCLQISNTLKEKFADEFENLKKNWIVGGCDLDLTEGLVLKRNSGSIKMDFSKSVESLHQMKIKYRDIRSKR